MAILVTGATGFLGSHLVKALLEHNYSVIALARSTSSRHRLASVLNHPQLTWSTCDEAALRKLFQQNTIQAIIHTATTYGRNKETALSSIFESNLHLPVLLCELACTYKVALFINTDSYFNKPLATYSALVHYALSKKSLQLWLNYYSQHFQVYNLVLEHLYGETDHPEKFVPSMVTALVTQQTSSLSLTHGEQQRDFIHVDDVVSAYLCVLHYALQTTQLGYHNLGVGTGETCSVRTWVETLHQASESKCHLNFGALPYRSDEIMVSVADTAALNALGWKPTISYTQGIERLITHARLSSCHSFKS